MTRRRPVRAATSMAVSRPLVRVDATEEQQVFARVRVHGEGVDVDAVVDRGRVVQARVPVGVADRDVGGRRVVALVHRHDLRRREAVDRRHDGGVDQPAVGQRQEVEAVVDDVEVGGALEDRGDVHALGDLRIDAVVLRPPARRRCCGAWRSSPSRRWRTTSRRVPAATRPSARSEANSSHGP